MFLLDLQYVPGLFFPLRTHWQLIIEHVHGTSVGN